MTKKPPTMKKLHRKAAELMSKYGKPPSVALLARHLATTPWFVGRALGSI